MAAVAEMPFVPVTVDSHFFSREMCEVAPREKIKCFNQVKHHNEGLRPSRKGALFFGVVKIIQFTVGIDYVV